jgi:predicted Zn-dependent protease
MTRLFGRAFATMIFCVTTSVSAVALASGGSSSSGGGGGGSGDDQKKDNPNYAAAVEMIQQKDFAGALTLLTSVVKRDPKNADAWNYIGFSDRMLGRFPESLVAYQKALAIQPNHLGANEYLGELYVQTGETDKARRQLAKLDQLCGQGCDQYKELASVISSGKVAELDPGSVKGW